MLAFFTTNSLRNANESDKIRSDFQKTQPLDKYLLCDVAELKHNRNLRQVQETIFVLTWRTGFKIRLKVHSWSFAERDELCSHKIHLGWVTEEKSAICWLVGVKHQTRMRKM